MPAEIWKDVPGYPGVTASSWGRIRLPDGEAYMPHGGLRQYKSQPRLGLWQPGTGGGRFTISNRKSLGKSSKKVAQLVCSAFHGPKPFPEAVVMHLDENSVNNCAYNLQWGSQKQNLNAPGFLDYCRSRTGENNPLIKGRSVRTT